MHACSLTSQIHFCKKGRVWWTMYESHVPLGMQLAWWCITRFQIMHSWIRVTECACPPRSIVEVFLLLSSSRKDDLALCCRFSDRYCYSNSDVMCHVTRYCNMIGHGLYTLFPFYRSGSGSWDQHACRYKNFSQLTCIGVGKSGHCSYVPWWQNQQFCHWSHPQHRHEWLQREPVFRSDLYGAFHQSYRAFCMEL